MTVPLIPLCLQSGRFSIWTRTLVLVLLVVLLYEKNLVVSYTVHRLNCIEWNGGMVSHAFRHSLHSVRSESASSFADYDLIPRWLQQRCNDLGYSQPNLVQELALPVVFSGKDIILQSQTGSGKTLVYALPVLSRIDASRASIQAVVVVPTRELGLQVCAVMKQLASGSPQKIMIMPLVQGSQNRRQQLWAVAEPPHIIVGNPKALQKLVDNGRLRLNSVSFVVLDEVDACLCDTDTKQDLHNLLSRRLSNTYKNVEEGNDVV